MMSAVFREQMKSFMEAQGHLCTTFPMNLPAERVALYADANFEK